MTIERIAPKVTQGAMSDGLGLALRSVHVLLRWLSAFSAYSTVMAQRISEIIKRLRMKFPLRDLQSQLKRAKRSHGV